MNTQQRIEAVKTQFPELWTIAKSNGRSDAEAFNAIADAVNIYQMLSEAAAAAIKAGSN